MGFDKSVALKSCCGIGGAYIYDGNRQCGAAGVPVCRNPDKFYKLGRCALDSEGI